MKVTCGRAALAAGVVSMLGFTAGAAEAAQPKAKAKGYANATPIVIGHRGAPAYRPEHTLASYELAIEMGADYIEPDLVSTKDHQLVARHENDITQTTDVAQHPEFAGRKTTKVIDGVSHTGWFTEDFTLAELRTLRAVERIPDIRPFNQVFNGLYPIPTLQEVIDLAKQAHVGIYPETKHPSYFRSIGLPIEGPLVRILKRNGLNTRRSKVFVQSFEVSNLKALDKRLKVPLIQLIDAKGAPADFVASGDKRTYDDLVTRKGLKEIATYADGIGPDKSRIIPVDATTKKLGTPTKLITWAHRFGLLVHPFTFRPENTFLPADYQLGDRSNPDFNRARGDEPAELKRYFQLGVDGLFADNADTARAVRDQLFG